MKARSVGCSKDTDCKDPRVCENTLCVDPQLAPHPAIPPVAAAKTENPLLGSGAKGTATTGPPPFAMFGGDARHTGRRGGPAPRKPPAALWSTAVGGVIAGSPTIGPDGTIYVAAHDGGLYAIGPGGAIAWKFMTGDRSWSTPA
ncbi:MAG TPA: PQQ-binding-like beta-propeller repeat protein, partial [Kofleriaceae bacterium]|nr:PQQ-binding-like beta-propeller repeat protein [Kofleriaceae bacterium]